MMPRLLWISLLIVFGGCADNDHPATNPSETSPPGGSVFVSLNSDPVRVGIERVANKPFTTVSVTNGKLLSRQQTKLHLTASGPITELPIREGQRLREGVLVARTDAADLQLELDQKRIERREAEFRQIALVVGNGGDPAVDTSLSAYKMEQIRIQSGTARLDKEIEQIERRLRQSTVRAPFAGVVADVKVLPYEWGNTGQELCRLIGTQRVEVQFDLTETEALRVRTGQRVTVHLGPDQPSFGATVSSVNPVVSPQGLVTVFARLNSTRGLKIIEGLNVEVRLETQLDQQTVVPRNALVQRDGREVVFTYLPDSERNGRVKWNYVDVLHQNADEIALAEALPTDSWVITSGNTQLTDGSVVTVDSLAQ